MMFSFFQLPLGNQKKVFAAAAKTVRRGLLSRGKEREEQAGREV